VREPSQVAACVYCPPFSRTRRVGADVPWVVQREVERRPEAGDEPVGVTHELLIGGTHRGPRCLSRAIGRAPPERPPTIVRWSRCGTRGSSPSRRASRRRGRRAGTSAVPRDVRRSSRASASARLAPMRRPRRSRPAASQSPAKRSIVAQRNHAEPDALAAPFGADAVHAVVPIAVPHQAGGRGPSVTRARALGGSARRARRARRRLVLRIPIVLVGFSGSPVKNGTGSSRIPYLPSRRRTRP
jgi:hypothetical protein